MGGNLVLRFGIDYPERSLGLVCYWPTGGVRWRMRMRKAFEDHAAFVAQNGIEGVRKRAQEKPGTFGSDPALGPWGNTLCRDQAFARAFEAMDKDRYLALATHSGWDLFDRDTAVGVEPEELMAIKVPTAIIPGDDAAHAHSAAHYVRECVPENRFLDGPVKSQDPENVMGFINGFLAEVTR
jgi:pimeloyl-ACP methyl ester carboxylesterase